tara:strand:- start:391 stop:615 length:225 start_codon:yes stop_codon:yes gene_type:complete
LASFGSVAESVVRVRGGEAGFVSNSSAVVRPPDRFSKLVYRFKCLPASLALLAKIGRHEQIQHRDLFGWVLEFH